MLHTLIIQNDDIWTIELINHKIIKPKIMLNKNNKESIKPEGGSIPIKIDVINTVGKKKTIRLNKISPRFVANIDIL